MVGTNQAKTIAAQRSHKDLLELWRDSLVVDGYTDPCESALHELSIYFEISEEEARERCLRWSQDSVKEWNAGPRDTKEGLLDFYRTQQSWIFDTVWYHAQQCYEKAPPESVWIADRLSNIMPGVHLDFGAGPGATSLFFNRLGWTISLADVSTTMQAFAKWRLERRGIDATFYDTSRDELPEGTFDLITACDVMVHVPDPRDVFERLHRALKVGGYLVFNVDARRESSAETTGFLYHYAYPVVRPVRAVGFSREQPVQGFQVFRKVKVNSSVRILAVTLYDTGRYNILVSKAGDALRAFKRSRHKRDTETGGA